MKQPIISVKNISFSSIGENGLSINLLDKISFEIAEGTITSLLCRKTKNCSILLKIIAKIVEPNEGSVNQQKKSIFIPSKPSSFPWLHVEENILYNIKNYDVDKYKSIIKFVGLNGYEKHFPDNRSIGFRFRIVLARALMNDAEVLILNEPFVSMDALTKNECKELLKRLKAENEMTVVLSSTNILESIYLSDKIIVLHDNFSGSIEKISCTAKSRTETIAEIENQFK